LRKAAALGKASRLWQGAAGVKQALPAAGAVAVLQQLCFRFATAASKCLPTRSFHRSANQEYIPYSIFSPFGFNGRYLYGRVAVNF
jgi:hypothetical protein